MRWCTLVVFMFPVKTGNNYVTGTEPMSRVCLSVCRSVARSSAETTEPILMKFGTFNKRSTGMMPMPSFFFYFRRTTAQ